MSNKNFIVVKNYVISRKHTSAPLHSEDRWSVLEAYGPFAGGAKSATSLRAAKITASLHVKDDNDYAKKYLKGDFEGYRAEVDDVDLNNFQIVHYIHIIPVSPMTVQVIDRFFQQ
jgi:hypothetical protein